MTSLHVMVRFFAPKQDEPGFIHRDVLMSQVPDINHFVQGLDFGDGHELYKVSDHPTWKINSKTMSSEMNGHAAEVQLVRAG